jgi:hypothetical protein
VFGWLKTVGMLRKTRHRGLLNVGWVFTFAAKAYSLVRMRNLLAAPVGAARGTGEACPKPAASGKKDQYLRALTSLERD